MARNIIVNQGNLTQPQRRWDLARGMMANTLRPIHGANAGTAIGKVLTAYLLNKNMESAETQENELTADAERASSMDRQGIIDAMTGTTPGQSARTGLDIPPQMDKTAGLMRAMESPNSKMSNWATQQMLTTPEPDKGTGLMQNLMAAGYTPGTPEYQKAVNDYLGKQAGTNIYMPPKLETGERPIYDGAGRLTGIEVIPGSTLDRKLKKEEKGRIEQEQAATYDTRMQKEKNTEFLGQVDDAIKNNTFWTTGMLGKVMSFWSGSDAFYQTKLLERIQGDVALERLAKAQAASKTGGVFGSLQKAELDLLKNSIEALEVGMTEGQMAKGLQGIQEHTLKWEGYQELWNDTDALANGFAGFGAYDEDAGGVEILDQAGWEAYQIQERTGIEQNYTPIGVYQ